MEHTLGVSGAPASVAATDPRASVFNADSSSLHTVYVDVGISDELAPIRFPTSAASRPPDPPPIRCPAPDCRAMEFRPVPNGGWRCLKSSHDPSAYLLAAVAGGEE